MKFFCNVVTQYCSVTDPENIKLNVDQNKLKPKTLNSSFLGLV